MPEFSVSRRQFLRLTTALVITGGAGALLDACSRVLAGSASPTAVSPAASPTATPALQGVGVSKAAPTLPAPTGGQVAITSNADFYTVAIGNTPDVPSDWKLTFGGNVTNPLSLTLDELEAMPAVEEMRTLECISNPAGGPLISNAVWKGLRMKDLVAQAGIKPDTVELRLDGFDGYSTAIPLSLAQDDHSFLVYEMNGVPLPPDHGKPLRCLWPGRYGMKQPKWLSKITAITNTYPGYWEQQGWSDQALIQTNSRIDAPADNSTVASPTLDMRGIGFSGASGIAKIEVSIDNGKTWQPAALVRGPTPYVWTNWTFSEPTPADGQYTLLARVTDNAGNTQTNGSLSLLGSTYPNGDPEMQPIVITVKKA